MSDSTLTHLKSRHHQPQQPQHRRRSWCCSFAVPPLSPDKHSSYHKSELLSKSSPISTNRRRILSPGRVSPIDETHLQTANFNPTRNAQPSDNAPETEIPFRDEGNLGNFDVRLSLRGKNGGLLVLELSSEVLGTNSLVFRDLIAEYRKTSPSGLCRIEVPDVENLGTFRETIELMFAEDIPKELVKIGVYRATSVLEVSSGIKFTRSVSSCLQYLEAVPWTEEEEEKLRILFNKNRFDDAASKDIFSRLRNSDSANSQETLARHMLLSITTSIDANARNELKSLVKGLLCKRSVYEKDYLDLNKIDIISVCQTCLDSLVHLFEEACGTNMCNKSEREEKNKPMIERISKHVDSINWLFEIMLEHQIAEDFVDIWTNQLELLKMHGSASPMIRYELSRVSAILFIAIGSRKLHCRSDARLGLLLAWFRPMLLDFGWLQRCRKGLDMKSLEETMGQALLTLPLKEQYTLFMDWFHCFSKHGTECPNLSKAFQIWWRRSFLRGSETHSIESR